MSKYMEDRIAQSPEFNRVFNKFAKIGNRVGREWLAKDPHQVTKQRQQIRKALNSLKSGRVSIKSLKDKNLQNACSILDMSANQIWNDSNVYKDMVKFLLDHPRFTFFYNSADKKVTIKNVLNRSKFKSQIMPKLQLQTTSGTVLASPHCVLSLILEIIIAVVGLIIMIIGDIIIEGLTVGAATPLMIVAIVLEVVLFLLGIALAVISFIDCRSE